MNGGFIFYSRCKAELTFTLFACVSPSTRARVVFSLFCTRSSIVAGVGFARVLFWKKKVTLWLESVSFVTWAVPPNTVIVYVASNKLIFGLVCRYEINSNFELLRVKRDIALSYVAWEKKMPFTSPARRSSHACSFGKHTLVTKVDLLISAISL